MSDTDATSTSFNDLQPGTRWIVRSEKSGGYVGQVREITRADEKVGVLWFDIADEKRKEEQTTSERLFLHLCERQP
jgi:hypothetical protein